MRTRIVAVPPKFDTGQYEDCDFLASRGDATLRLRFAELIPFEIFFQRVRWHQFIAQPNCTSEQIRDAYFQLVELVGSPAVADYVERDKSPRKAYSELHHYRIYLDETGCFEVFAQVAAAVQ